MPTFEIDPLIAAAVVVATACTDAVYGTSLGMTRKAGMPKFLAGFAREA